MLENSAKANCTQIRSTDPFCQIRKWFDSQMNHFEKMKQTVPSSRAFRSPVRSEIVQFAYSSNQRPLPLGKRLRSRLPKRHSFIQACSETEDAGFVVGRIARRTLLVSFKCNVCGSRTERLVNPIAWNNGAVFLQCENCKTWHAVKDNLNLIEEIRYNEDEE